MRGPGGLAVVAEQSLRPVLVQHPWPLSGLNKQLAGSWEGREGPCRLSTRHHVLNQVDYLRAGGGQNQRQDKSRGPKRDREPAREWRCVANRTTLLEARADHPPAALARPVLVGDLGVSKSPSKVARRHLVAAISEPS